MTEEATFYAPEAYRQHIEELTSGYARSLKQACTRGQLERFAPEEMDMLANLLFGARRQMMWRFMQDNKLVPTPPAETVETYLKFISEGVLGGRVVPARRPD